MTLHLRPTCPECGEEVERAGDLCVVCEEAELVLTDDDDFEDEICQECHDVNCDGDCYDEADDFEYDVVNSEGDIA